jgi:hypothetical protein
MTKFGADLTQIIQDLNPANLLRQPVVALLGMMNNRIHNLGLASDGSQIGQYKDSYLKIRERYKHSGTDKKVILVLTRKLSNSWLPIATENGYGIGFTTGAATASVGVSGEGVTEMDKIIFAEQHFGKKIFDMTQEESDFVNQLIAERAAEIINAHGRA